MSASCKPLQGFVIIVLLLLASASEVVAQCDTDCSLIGSDFWTRDHLTGDLCRVRPCLAEKGIIADLQLTQFYQGVTSGGGQQEFLYGGKLDYFFTFQGEKLGLNKGFYAILHAESLFGDSIRGQAGAFAFPNVNMLYPLPGEHVTSITGLLAIQALNERVSLAAGKINVVDFWNMVYPHTGRGIDGFMNLSSISAGLPWLRFINLSVMGAGVLVMKEKQIQGGLLVFDTNNSTTTAGLNNLFDKGAAILGVWRFFTDCNGRPTSHLFAGGWSSRTYTSLDKTSWTILPGQGLETGKESGAWSLAYYFDQVFWTDPCNKKRNLRLFSGWLLSDGNPSFAKWSGLVSVEGTGLLCRRPEDRMGVAWFYTDLSDDFRQLVERRVVLEELQGVELYYNAEITPSFHLTADLQIIDNERKEEDTTIVFGLRAKINL